MRHVGRIARLVVVLVIGASALGACGISGELAASESTTTKPGSPITSSTSAPASTSSTTPASSGAAGAGCVNGWTTPAVGSPERQEPLDLIRAQMGVAGLFKVDEMRNFTGPDVSDGGAAGAQPVERWYVKASLVDDPNFRARWIVERRSESDRGIAGVAAYETVGYESPDWKGFVGEGTPRAVPGLPGQWSGLEYDFVKGKAGDGNGGIPEDNLGCLDGI
jgi:hypothetical protein